MRQFLPALLVIVTGAVAVAGEQHATRDDLTEVDRARVEKVTRPASAFETAEPFERMQAGAATSVAGINADAFSHPSANLDFEGRQRFLVGNGLFRREWVSAPSSTRASDGLGPLFNARACQSCHIKDGRGHAPLGPSELSPSLLVRLSVAPTPAQEKAILEGYLSSVDDPTYGGQLQGSAVAGLPPEGRVAIRYDEGPVVLKGGETVTLRRPRLAIEDPAFGPLHQGVMFSARVAPPMIGLGLLEAIDEGDIFAREDPDDRDGDGISGRARTVRDETGALRIGRFGWKGNAASVRQQAAAAFSGDMGLSTPLFPDHWGDCTRLEVACRATPGGAGKDEGAVEIPADLLDLVTFYSRNLAVPARRDVDDPRVLGGKRLFHEVGCAGCHTPKYVTRRDAAVPALAFQLIWPYTDLLLHDMGEGLADGRPEGTATGREWRTPALWGIGLSGTVHREASFLHDGRARTLLEAVLWHGGEAKASRDRVVEMEKADRQSLIRFLESL